VTASSPGLHGSVLDSLGVRLVTADLPEGRVLTLEAIAAEYAVSRPVAREAIRVLQSMGMVASRRRVGVTVLPRAHWHVFDPLLIRWRLDSPERSAQLLSLSELRRGFEPVAAALAAERATAEQCSTLASAASDMVVHGRAGDLEAYLQADVVFHRTLLAASGNEMLQSLSEVVAEILAGRTHHGLMPSRPNPQAIALHDAVARAVREREPATAEAAMREIIDESAAAMRAELGE
jgi:DNA-binding FadR family transcriptional regulator